MQKVQIEFTIQLDKNIHESINHTRESFCNKHLINQICKAHENIEKYIENDKDKEKYTPYIKMIKDNRENLKNTVTYELIQTNKNLETVKIKFIFNYYENTIFSLKRTLEEEIFITPMQYYYFVAESTKKSLSENGKESERFYKVALELYTYLGDLCYQAYYSANVNGQSLQSESII